ncbi:MAG: outer membrane lipoprotein-sorting protein [Gammaproteobacteria bacterium]
MHQPINGPIRAAIAALLVGSALGAGAQSAEAPAPATATATGASPAQDDAAARERASEIVRRADEIRFPRDAFSVEVRVSSTIRGEAQEVRRYRILSRDSEDTIVQTLEPEVERGQNLLMKGRELWMFLPSVSQPVRLSLSQRLTGQVANGDLARTQFAKDYDARLVGSEKIDGKDHHVLELTATERGMTYPKIRYWVRASDLHPHRAEFHAMSGKLLKTCRFENYQTLGGRVRPTRLVMTDALKEGDESVLDYSGLAARSLPARMFTKEYLKRL